MITRTLWMATLAAGCLNVQDQVDLDEDTDEVAIEETGEEDTEDPVDLSEAELPIPFCINEIMAYNRGSLTLPSGESPDWIELHNPTLAELRLLGWQIADSQNPEAWSPLDEIVLAPGAFVVVYASGAGIPGPRQLNFQLSNDGDSVVVRAPDGRRMTVNFPASAGDMSYARETDCCTGEGCWMASPYGTPEQSNGTGGGPIDTGMP